MSSSSEMSVVEWFADHEGYRCGYCNSPDTNYSHGMWGHSLTVWDHQSLIDRGWSRSGKYVYKPTLTRTCCPQYIIRCAALDFKISKSQRRVIKRVNSFINQDIRPSAAHTSNEQQQEQQQQQRRPQPKPGVGADPNKPRCVKSKLVRRARHEHNVNNSASVAADERGKGDTGPSLEDLLNNRVDKPAHKLELRLVRSAPRSEAFDSTLSVSHSVFTKYQTAVHKDKPDELTMSRFIRSFVDSPLIPESRPGSEDEEGVVGYGSYHYQYWLDGVLIAVTVLDILPNCISSEYFFSDPEYSFLSLGTYSALQELALTRSLHRSFSPHISYYYMGFYIQSCPKMRYKGQYYPSCLLCPETYQWFPLSHCKPLLEKNKYSRFNPDPLQDDAESRSVDVDSVLCLHSHRPMLFSEYCNKKKREGKVGAGGDEVLEVEKETLAEGERESVALYAKFVGASCAHSMLLYRA